MNQLMLLHSTGIINDGDMEYMHHTLNKTIYSGGVVILYILLMCCVTYGYIKIQKAMEKEQEGKLNIEKGEG